MSVVVKFDIDPQRPIELLKEFCAIIAEYPGEDTLGIQAGERLVKLGQNFDGRDPDCRARLVRLAGSHPYV